MLNSKKKKSFWTLDEFYFKNKELSKANAKLLFKISASLTVLLLTYCLVFIIGQFQFANWKSILAVCGCAAVVFGAFTFILYRFKVNNYSNTTGMLVVTYVFIFAVYAFAIGIACTGKYPAAVFLAVLLAIPLILTIEPKLSYLYSIVSTAVYLILSYFLKSTPDSNVFSTDLLNCLGVLFLNIVIGNFYFKNRKEEFMVRQQYKHLSGVDELTELANRRQFNISYEKNYYKCLNEKHSIGLFLMDIDDFKNYNDYYGHLGGDECLKKVGRFFRQYTEKNPGVSFYRYGGEEFIGVAYNIDRKAANAIAGDLVSGIRELGIKHMTSTVSDVITISVGAVLQYPSVLSNSADFINLADKAMYKVKENGKNGFLFY